MTGQSPTGQPPAGQPPAGQPPTGQPLEERLIAEVPGLRAFARSLTQDAASADDLVQETLLRAWAKLDSFEEGTNLRAWLFTILRNTFISGKRKVKREVEDSEGHHAARLVEAPRQDGAASLGNFRRALSQLPQEQREALMLVGAVGFTYEETAEVCNCSSGTIKSRVNRARRRLDDLLQSGEEAAAEGPEGPEGPEVPEEPKEPEDAPPPRRAS